MKKNCYTKQRRMRKRREFLRLKQMGHKLNGRHFFAIFAANDFAQSRLGVTVTKKIGCAVVRNRIRRSAREAFRLRRPLARNPLDIHLIAKNSAAEADNSQLTKCLNDLFGKLEAHENR